MLFHDSKTGFTLDLSGFRSLQCIDTLERKYNLAVMHIFDNIEAIEQGEIVNTTAVKSESENRRVDHYNHRIKQPQGSGDFLSRSLQSTLDYNKKVVQDVQSIISGGKTKEGHVFTDVVFNSIGGSFLGPLMLLISQKGESYNDYLPLKLHFVSNTDPESFHDLFSRISVESTLCVHMSKSGSTAETAGNLEAFSKMLNDKNLDIGSRNCAVTTEGSPFDKKARTDNYRFIWYMKEETGGRTSIVSAIGMVPAAFGGLDFAQFVLGMSDMDELTRKPSIKENPALLISLGIDKLFQEEGRKNMIVLGYSDYLKEVSHYLQQLYMESLGKEYDIDGVPSRYGLTVFGGVGTGEQHAFMQQIQKGIDDAFVRFISFRKRNADFLNTKTGSMGRQLLGFVKGTQQALSANGRSWMSIQLEERNEYAIGLLIALEERIVSCLAALKRTNAYDQPGVQAGKLAANNFNKVSLKLEQYIGNGHFTSGTADLLIEKASNELQTDCKDTVEAILNDMSANWNVDNAYPLLINQLTGFNRSFDDGKFVFEVVRK
ncbi:hypothetical protein P9112_011192 [Eukaryota sp. TZLM1-RC]